MQGVPNMYIYNFKHWQYIDILLFIGQGLFSIPTPGYIDSAHRNGVKILGGMMTPVNQEEYITQFKYLFGKSSDGVFVFADKMVTAMDHYGFDGWFFNIEESLPNTIKAKDVRDFMIYLNKKSKQINPNAEIHWYDSNYVFGNPGYEEQLDNNNVSMFEYEKNIVSDGFFLDYSWTTESLKQQ